ncbi:MAG: restriction endonuclease subunit S [Bacteroidia bacterium]|nr:restriction endonuclease subunit S [Bacteroidia bacterium]
MEIASVSYTEIMGGFNILKPNYHLNYGKKRVALAIKAGKKFDSLGTLTDNIYTGGIFKRLFVEKESHGLPYISAQHMMNSNPLEIAKLISKKHTPRQEDMTLKENQILVSCAGTVGNVRLVTKDLNGIIGSQDIIRVICDCKKAPYGFIFAYLASPTAYNYIQSFIYGSVVPRIEPNTLSKLPVPKFSNSKQQIIHDLIVEASNYRVKANKLLTEALFEIDSQFKYVEDKKVFSVNISTIKDGDKYTKELRLECDYYQPSTVALVKYIKKNFDYALLGDLSDSVTISNLRGRTFVKKGVALITGQSLGLLKPDVSKQLSKTLTKNIAENTTKNGDVLVSAFGTLGKTEYCFNNFYTGVFASQQLVRIRTNKEKIHSGYIYLYLKSKAGQALIQKYKTGSVIEWANWNNFSSIPVPIPEDKGKALGKVAEKIAQTFQVAFEKEAEAINIIENEIESWQK